MSHFARSQWLGVLKMVLGDADVVIPDVVATELRQGSGSHPYLQAVLDEPWIVERSVSTGAEMAAFA